MKKFEQKDAKVTKNWVMTIRGANIARSCAFHRDRHLSNERLEAPEVLQKQAKIVAWIIDRLQFTTEM